MSQICNKILKGLVGFSMALALVASTAVCSTTVLADNVSSPENVSEDQPGYGKVNITSGTLNVRSTATTTADNIVASLEKDSMVMIVGETGTYYKVMYNTSGNYGYAAKTYITFISNIYYLQVQNVDSGSTLNLRSTASTSSSILAGIPSNAYFAYCGESGSWYQGVYGTAQGYVSSAYAVRRPYTG